MHGQVFFALLLSLLAGLSTAIGAAMVFFVRTFDRRLLAFSLAFSTGVMVSISLIEILPSSISLAGLFPSLAVFFAGYALIFAIDRLVPHDALVEMWVNRKERRKNADRQLAKTGLFVALGLAIHNFPEGMAVMVSGLYNLKLGLLVAVAIALHNIPEGVSVSMPVLYATKSRRDAFKVALMSGMAEPVGALIAALFLLPFFSQTTVAFALAFVAGVMVFVSLHELLPSACAHCEKNLTPIMLGLLFGGLAMAGTSYLLSLLL